MFILAGAHSHTHTRTHHFPPSFPSTTPRPVLHTAVSHGVVAACNFFLLCVRVCFSASPLWLRLIDWSFGFSQVFQMGARNLHTALRLVSSGTVSVQTPVQSFFRGGNAEWALLFPLVPHAPPHCHTVTLKHCYTVTLLHCHTVTLPWAMIQQN